MGPEGQCVLCRREGVASSSAARVSERPASAAPLEAPTTPRVPPANVSVAGGGILRPLLWLVAASLGVLVVVLLRANHARTVAMRTVPLASAADRTPDVPEGAAEEAPSPAPKRERVRPRIRPEERGETKPSSDEVGEEGAAPPSASAGAAQGEAAPPAASEPIDARALLSNVSVTLYTTSWCGYCKKARALLLRNGIPFRERDVEHDPSAESAHRRLNPDGGVPTFDIEGDVFTGYSPARIANSLERAIYAKSGQRAEIRFSE